MINPEQYAKALFEAIAETNPKDHDKVLDNFVEILRQNGDVAKYPQIEYEFQKLLRASKGIRDVEITIAREMDAKELVRNLNNVIGSKADVKTKIDAGIIGGVVVKIGETLIDASVKNSLNNLKRDISK